MAVTSNINSLIQRLRAKVAETAPDSPQLKEALTRIGLAVAAAAKLEARRKGIIDTGRLINSIRYEFFRQGSRQGILVGSFNVPYAAMHEFGGTFTDQMRRAMFAAKRNTVRTPRPAKGVVVGQNFRARPYLRPAINKNRLFIIDTLRAAITFANQGDQ